MPLRADQIQPASLDLRLGARACRVRASFLPGAPARSRPASRAFALHEIDLRPGAVLETGCVYIAELQEALALPADIAAGGQPEELDRAASTCSPASSPTAAAAFDQVEAGYRGPLYAEISPRTFPVLVRTGSRLSQIRFRRGERRG